MVSGGAVAVDAPREVRGLGAGMECHVAPGDDVCSSPGGAPDTAAYEKPTTSVHAASNASDWDKQCKITEWESK